MKNNLFLIDGTPEKLLTFFATGENTTTDINATTTDTLTPEMKTYYDKLLIRNKRNIKFSIKVLSS